MTKYWIMAYSVSFSLFSSPQNPYTCNIESILDQIHTFFSIPPPAFPIRHPEWAFLHKLVKSTGLYLIYYVSSHFHEQAFYWRTTLLCEAWTSTWTNHECWQMLPLTPQRRHCCWPIWRKVLRIRSAWRLAIGLGWDRTVRRQHYAWIRLQSDWIRLHRTGLYFRLN